MTDTTPYLADYVRWITLEDGDRVPLLPDTCTYWHSIDVAPPFVSKMCLRLETEHSARFSKPLDQLEKGDYVDVSTSCQFLGSWEVKNRYRGLLYLEQMSYLALLNRGAAGVVR